MGSYTSIPFKLCTDDEFKHFNRACQEMAWAIWDSIDDLDESKPCHFIVLKTEPFFVCVRSNIDLRIAKALGERFHSVVCAVECAKYGPGICSRQKGERSWDFATRLPEMLMCAETSDGPIAKDDFMSAFEIIRGLNIEVAKDGKLRIAGNLYPMIYWNLDSGEFVQSTSGIFDGFYSQYIVDCFDPDPKEA